MRTHPIAPAILFFLSLAGVCAHSQTLSGSGTLPGSGALPLRTAVEVALTGNLQIVAAALSVRIAEQQVREAYAGVWPQVSAEASYLRSLGAWSQRVVPDEDPEIESDTSNAPDNTWTASLKLNQTVMDFRVFSGLAAADNLLSLRGEERRGAAHQVVDLVRQSYFNVLLAAEREALTEQSIARVRQTLRETRARHSEGFASDDELLRAEVQFTNLETRLILARNQVAAARGRLLVALGVDPLQPVAVSGSLSELQLAPGAVNSAGNADLLAASGAVALAAMTEEELRQAAFTLRSDLRQLRSSVTLGEIQVEVQQREVLPVIRAFGSVDFRVADNDEDDVFGSPLGPERYSQWDLSASAGLSIQVPVFSGFRPSARLEQRREELRLVTSRLRQAELDMVNQVRTLAASMREARARAASQRVAIVQSQRGYDIATARYRAGVGSQFEVVAAETTLREAEFNYAQAVYDYLSTASRLEVATGQVPLVDRSASTEEAADG
ncbi:MAG: TolC family protein [Spirochaetaceae bacterium]|nr:TolC family protein [Spirochaetaceae bacterium]